MTQFFKVTREYASLLTCGSLAKPEKITSTLKNVATLKDSLTALGKDKTGIERVDWDLPELIQFVEKMALKLEGKWAGRAQGGP